MMVSIMSACLGGLFLICLTFILFLYITARRARPQSPSPSSSTGAKVSLAVQLDGIGGPVALWCSEVGIMSDLN